MITTTQILRYETDSTVSGHLLAASIYGPSYLSFEFALSWHGLIPEAVYNYTAATFGKNKKKTYRNAFGLYLFRDVPINVFRFGLEIRYENDYPFLIASPEKAICDKLYTVPPVNNQKDLIALLFDDLWIDETDFWNSDLALMSNIAGLYRTKNQKLLVQIIRKRHHPVTYRNNDNRS